ncbi:MAG TPA: glycosyltransferase [Coleofasciculaceae cyanobacterium]
MRQHGDRCDLPHLCGYDAAYKLFAPYPEILEFSGVPNWIRDKTIYSPGFSRYSQSKETKLGAREKLDISPQQEVVLVINGKGGGKYSRAKIAAAAEATPEWLWLTVGEIDRDYDNLPSNVSVLGWREDTYPYLKAADVAIASGGHNTVMEIGTAQVPFLCIPELRPFQEQQIKAILLEKLGLCFCSETFPGANSARLVLNKLKQLDVTQWGRIMAIDGAAQAAKAIESEIKLLSSYLAVSSSSIASTGDDF